MFKHMYSISGEFAIQYILGFYQLQMDQDIGKARHRKSANNKGYLKNKERYKYTSISCRLDSHLPNFEASIQTGVFRKISICETKTNSEHLFIT